MVLFESLDTLSYSPSVLTMALSWALSCIVCEIERLIGRKSGNFYTHLHLALRKGRPCWNFAKLFDTRKTRTIALRFVEEIMTIYQAVSIEYRNVTDRQTDRQTELLYQYRTSVC